jgi:predicted dehydrogenase
VLERAAGTSGTLEGLAGFDFGDLLHTEMLEIAEAEPLKEEIRQFLAAVRGETAPRVSGEQGLAALRVAERILADVAARPLPVRT